MFDYKAVHGVRYFFKCVMILIGAIYSSLLHNSCTTRQQRRTWNEEKCYHLSEPPLAGGLELPRHESRGSSLLEDRNPAPADGG